METYKFSFFTVSLCIVLLSLPFSFAHPKTCPANCVCTCPPTSSQSPPSNNQNQPPSIPPSDNNQSPPSQESTPSPSDNNQPPPSQESPSGQASPPQSNGNQPPSSEASPPQSNDNQPPSSQGSSPPASDNGASPPSQGSPPTSNNGAPPPSQGSPPTSDNGASPPSQGSPPTSNNGAPPPSQGSPPTSDNGASPPSQGSPPTSDNGAPPPSPSSNQNQPPSSNTPSQGSPPTSDNGAPPSTNENTPPTQGSSPPQYGQSPPSGQTNSSGSVIGNGSLSGSFKGTFKGSFKRVCAFGDSFTDTGNAFLSDGLKSFASGSYSTQYSGQRMSNGRLVIDFLCDSLDLPPLPAYKKTSADFSSGCNFAIAGSTALSQDFFSKNQFSHTLMWKNPMSFDTQISWFNNFLSNLACKGKSDAECQAEMANTLFWIGEFGGNDYSRTFGSRIKFTWLQEMAVGQVCKTINAMIARGAKYIVVQGLPPVGCCPLEMALRGNNDQDNMGCSSIGNAMVKAHNALLQMRLAEIRKQNSGCMIVYADTWNAFNTILSNHQKFGFAEPFKACCGAGGGKYNFDLHSLCGSSGTSTCKNPQQFISWDGIHLTEEMHKHIADLFFHGGFCQPSFDELVKAKMAHVSH